MTTPGLLVLEAALAEQLGIDRSLLIEARIAVLSEKDLARAKRGIAYPPSAVEKLCAHLRLPVPPPAAPVAEPGTPVRLFVARPARLNRHLLFAVAEKKDGATEIAVRVRDARMFVPGQEIAVRLDGHIAHLHGPQPRQRGRLPRQKGRV